MIWITYVHRCEGLLCPFWDAGSRRACNPHNAAPVCCVDNHHTLLHSYSPTTHTRPCRSDRSMRAGYTHTLKYAYICNNILVTQTYTDNKSTSVCETHACTDWRFGPLLVSMVYLDKSLDTSHSLNQWCDDCTHKDHVPV